MARITAYEASDKTLHRDRKSYIRHESNLLAAKKVNELVQAKLAERAASLGVETLSLSPAAVAAFLVDNINEVREALNVVFKPGAEEGEPATDGETGTEPGTPEGTPAAEPEAQAEPVKAGADI